MSKPADLRHAYWHEQQQGAEAHTEAECPYHMHAGEIGKRCAWLAGYRDSKAWNTSQGENYA